MFRVTVTTDFSGFDSDKILREAMANYARQARQRISGMRCPEHGQTPTIESRGEDGFTIRACCDEHAQRAAKAATR